MEKMQTVWKWVVQQKELVVIILSGLLILFFIDHLLVQKVHQDEKYRETLMVERLQAQVQSSLEEHVTALIGLQVVYQNFTDISHYDFQQYGESIASDMPGFRRLFYIDPNMTIREVYPLTPENAGLIGYSVKKDAKVVALLNKARLRHDPATSDLFPFFSHPNSYWAAIPIYRNKNQFLGYAAGELSLTSIWQPYAKPLDRFQMQLSDPQGTRLFQQVNIDDNSPVLVKMPFKLGDQTWTLSLNPTRIVSTEALALQRASLWLGGLLILNLAFAMMTSSRRHKSEMKEAQQQFETIFEASPDGIILLNDRLEVQLSNPAVEKWLGREEGELEGKNFFDFFRCDCPNINKCPELSHLLCTTKGMAGELPEVLETTPINAPDGAPTTLRLNASKYAQERDGVKEKGFICVLGDISTTKELSRVKETYVATLTHDLKTPLLAQQMVLDRLNKGHVGKINDEQGKLLVGAIESVGDMLDMVNITLLFYKLESTSVSLAKQKMQMANVIKDVITTLTPIAEKRQMPITLEAGIDLPEISVDAIQMKRVLHNLISNALTYGKKGTPLEIRVEVLKDTVNSDADSLQVVITNQGKGIQPEDLPRIFDKYYSLSRRFKQIGTGLGLYISRRLIELHGGKIWAESEPDKYASYFITLPIAQQVNTSPEATSLRSISA